MDDGQDVAPGPHDFQFPLHFNDHVVPAGHHLLLVLKASDDYVQRSPYHDDTVVRVGDGVSWLQLPTIPDAARTVLDDAPAPWSHG